MARHILRCRRCRAYSMEEKCRCGGEAITTRPPKYTPKDKYAKYRRIAKRNGLEKEGLI